MEDSPQSLGAVLRATVHRLPDKVSHRVPAGKEFVDHTYSEMFEMVFERARALDAIGLKKGDRLAIIGETCFEWGLTDWAAQTLGIVTVPVYPTLPPDQAQYIVTDAGVSAAIVSDEEQAAKLVDVPTFLWSIPTGDRSFVAQADQSSLTHEEWDARIDSVKKEDLATLIYTSGTTGHPKGVMLPHRCFISLTTSIRECLPIYESDSFLSWLPMAHVFERFAGHILPVSLGATVAYAGSIVSLGADMIKVQPTVVLAVPRFLESIRARVVENVRKQSPVKQKLFDLALSQGIKRFRGEFAPLHGILDKLVGEKIREKTGGKLRFFVSGGAALPPHVCEFFLAFNITVLQGYGLTETTAASSLNLPESNRPWTVGPPIRGVEMKIAADGEILIRGEAVMDGYYNLPDATKEAIDADGWFHTGDIGEFEGDRLKITDRKKDLLVLANGKNVAPQPIENHMKESEFIAEAVLLGDGMETCCALVVPDFERLKVWLESQGVKEENQDSVIAREDVKQLIKSEIQSVNQKLADYERIRRHCLLPRAFSIDDGELTPSMKVRRKVVKEHFAEAIASMTRPSN